VPLHDNVETLGLILPLMMVLLRTGCFLSGCCYGCPSARWGVHYPAETLRRVDGCRRFTPGPAPTTAVFPVQLVEAAVHLLLFVGLAAWAHARGPALRTGTILLSYFAAYSIARFVLDFARAASARPRRAGLSEAQCMCLALAPVSTALLAM